MESDVTFTMCGTPEYYSPEMIRKTGYNKNTDFWSLGILLYEMLIGCTPFIDSDPLKIYQKINQGKVLFPKQIDKSAKMIIILFDSFYLRNSDLAIIERFIRNLDQGLDL